MSYLTAIPARWGLSEVTTESGLLIDPFVVLQGKGRTDCAGKVVGHEEKLTGVIYARVQALSTPVARPLAQARCCLAIQ